MLMSRSRAPSRRAARIGATGFRRTIAILAVALAAPRAAMNP